MTDQVVCCLSCQWICVKPTSSAIACHRVLQTPSLNQKRTRKLTTYPQLAFVILKTHIQPAFDFDLSATFYKILSVSFVGVTCHWRLAAFLRHDFDHKEYSCKFLCSFCMKRLPVGRSKQKVLNLFLNIHWSVSMPQRNYSHTLNEAVCAGSIGY